MVVGAGDISSNQQRLFSLHVDDFLVLELKGQQPTVPTGYNKQSMKAAKELFAQREVDAEAAPDDERCHHQGARG